MGKIIDDKKIETKWKMKKLKNKQIKKQKVKQYEKIGKKIKIKYSRSLI